MKSLSKIAAFALAFALVSGPLAVFAADSATSSSAEKTESKPEKKKGAVPFHGKLSAVDQTAKTISVGERSFQVTSDTRIMKNGKPATLADAAVGEAVGGSYRKNDDGTMALISLRVGPKPEKEGDAAKPKRSKESKE